MFGTNNYGGFYYGQGPSGLTTIILRFLDATTRFISGFKRTTRREY